MNTELSGIDVISDICVKNKKTNRAKILEWEERAKKLPQVDIPVKHNIHGGMYCREITIPKGTVLTGQIYMYDHFDIMISGDITVSTDTGEVRRLQGFNLFNGLCGKKRAGYAHEDTRWMTFHAFDGDNGEEIQKQITAESFDELELFHVEVNRNDYLNMVDSIGMTQEEIDDQVKNTKDMTDLPKGHDHLYVSNSNIDGKGFYSSKKLLSGDVIAPARIKDLRTNAGRYCNHAFFSNAKIVLTSHGADLVAKKDIEKDEEITVDYRNVMKIRLIGGDL